MDNTVVLVVWALSSVSSLTIKILIYFIILFLTVIFPLHQEAQNVVRTAEVAVMVGRKKTLTLDFGFG